MIPTRTINSLKLILFSLLCIVCAEERSNACCVPTDDVEGYYWRDYKGEIPRDALAAGLDKEGNELYVGQVLYRGYLIPGRINGTDKKIYFIYDTEQSVTVYIKILCTQHPENYQWILTSSEEFSHLAHKNLMPEGGYQLNYEVYIGRLTLYGETHVGKVLVNNNKAVLYTAIKGKVMTFETFEVLSLAIVIE